MEIKLVNRGDTAELIFADQFDDSEVEEVLNILSDVCDRFRNIVVNVNGLEYVSLPCLKVLKALYMRLSKTGGSLSVSGASPAIKEVFEMTGYTSFLRVL